MGSGRMLGYTRGVVISSRDAAIHLGLFAACCVTTGLVGGPYFAATLMGILLCHELGHYVISRRRGVEVSLPYFIPVPPWGTFGTLGAVIRMQKPISERNALFDVGAAGPVAGLVIAVPLLVVGLMLSDLGATKPDEFIEGNSILYALLKYAVFGHWLPGPRIDNHLPMFRYWLPLRIDVQLHPMAFAGWVGLLITMINLIPIGQLDGGHVARAALGQAHEKWSGRMHVVLPVIGIIVGGVMFVLARRTGLDVTDSLSYAQSGVLPWLVWTLLLGWMRRQAGEYHPPVEDTPLDSRRRRYAFAMLVIFLLIATPVPFRPAL